MNLQQLRSLSAFMETGSFSAAANSVGLSHSAISIQMKLLEESLDATLFDRGRRPPILTLKGERIATLSRQILNTMDDIRAAAAGDSVGARITLGVVRTTLHTLLPAILNELKRRLPNLQVEVVSGLSGELAAKILHHELDLAIVTSPASGMADLRVTEIATEQLFAIGPLTSRAISNDRELVLSSPFISFSRHTWLGQQIFAHLQSRDIHVNKIMEVDSLDAVEQLVEDGFGVSIVPQRLLAKKLSDRLTCIPFGNPPKFRKLVMIQPAHGHNTELARIMEEICSQMR